MSNYTATITIHDNNGEVVASRARCNFEDEIHSTIIELEDEIRDWEHDNSIPKNERLYSAGNEDDDIQNEDDNTQEEENDALSDAPYDYRSKSTRRSKLNGRKRKKNGILVEDADDDINFDSNNDDKDMRDTATGDPL